MLPGCQGRLGGFRYGDISWKTCDGGFYDPLFPEVCEKCVSSNPALCVGVTVRVAISTDYTDGEGTPGIPTDVQESPFLTHVKVDVEKFKQDGTRTLRLFRSRPQTGIGGTAKELRIGYLNGLGDAAEPPDVNDPYSGLVDCPVEPCFGTHSDYLFKIDRLSPDGDVVYARFSFQQKFSSFGSGDYSVYMDGCCRPKILGIEERGNFVFHIRAGMKLPSSAAVDFPRQSIVFSMPDVVTLRAQGNAKYNPGCQPESCSGSCYARFQIQAYHPDDTYNDKIRYYIGSENELGKYRCNDLTPDLMCGNGHGLGESFLANDQITIDPITGIVAWPTSSPKLYQVTIMAECEGCAGGSRDRGNVMAVPIDLIVEVVLAENNPNQPIATFVRSLQEKEGVPGVTLSTTREEPVVISCGNNRFLHAGVEQSFIRVGFKDRDDLVIVNECDAALKPQELRYIKQAAEFPKGVQVSGLTRVTGGAAPHGAGFVDITWRPQCEDPSQVGRFMLCFEARDQYHNNEAFVSLASSPSPVESTISQSSEKPTCVHVQVLSASENAVPQLLPPTEHTQCSEDCCSCCGRSECQCEGVTECCLTKFATASKLFNYTVRAFDSDVFQKIGLNFSFPEGTGALDRVPSATPLVYGCAPNEPYMRCVERGGSGATNDVMGQLVWDLRGIGKYMCTPPGANRSVTCDGLGDVTTCAGGTPCTKLESSPIKVCFQIVEIVPEYVDRALWRRTFNAEPGGASCKVCFKLQVSDRPFFEDVTTPRAGTIFNLAVGETLDVPLLAASEIVGEVKITMLSDPGAPIGAALTRTELVAFPDVDSGLGYKRRFQYTPQASQRGHTYTVCFQAVSPADGKEERSDRRCWRINVLAAVVSWDGTTPCPAGDDTSCPSAGHVVEATVGCPIAMAVRAAAPKYPLLLSMQQHPALEGGPAVPPCATSGGGPCCGNGHCDGAESAASCPADCHEPAPVLVQSQVGSAQNGFVSEASLAWTPTRGDEGRAVLLCVEAADQTFGTAVVDPTRGASGTGPSLCVTFAVARCAYCVPEGATLRNVARHYMLNLDWLRLYNSNPETPDPDKLAPLQRIRVGPTYSAKEGDSLVTIAASMRTTVKALLDHNRDLLDAAALHEGQKVCVLLCSAVPAVV